GSDAHHPRGASFEPLAAPGESDGTVTELFPERLKVAVLGTSCQARAANANSRKMMQERRMREKAGCGRARTRIRGRRGSGRTTDPERAARGRLDRQPARPRSSPRPGPPRSRRL